MGWPKGKPRGGRAPNAGRKKGTPNQRTQDIRERLELMGCDYVGYLAKTVMNEVPCAVCRGAGRTKFQPHGGKRFSGERTCQSCWGSGMEKIEPKQSAWAAAELMQYCEAKRKAIDITSSDGSLLSPSRILRERFVKRNASQN